MREKSKAGTGRLLGEKPISDFIKISSHEGQPEAGNGKDSWGALSKGTRGFGRANAGSGAGSTAHQGLPLLWTLVQQFSFLCTTAPFEKHGLG